MNWWHKLRASWCALIRKEKLDAEMSEEMRAHVAFLTEENIRAGMTAQEARRAALRDFGPLESLKEACRDQRGIVWVETMASDIRFAVRMLRKNAGFAVVTILTLALGIGVNSSIFSVVNAVLIRPLPYPEPERLVCVCESNQRQGWSQYVTSIGAYADWHRQNSVFEDLAAATVLGPTTAVGSNGAELVHVGAVSAGFFPLLGAHPLLGRPFIAEEENPDHGDVVLVSEGFWRQYFGADVNVLNRSIRLGDRSFNVVGIMPSSVRLFDPAGVRGWDNGFSKCDLWRPLPVDSGLKKQRNYRAFLVLGRLKHGVTVAQAQTGMTRIAEQQARDYPESNSGWTTTVQPWRKTIVRNARLPLLLLLAAVVLVLLIATANLANLVLARAFLRQKEFAVRMALGAGRNRLARQCVTEGLLLASLGGAAGLLLGHWANGLVRILVPMDVPRLHENNLDGRVMVFTFGVSVAVGLIFGLAPLLTFWGGEMNEWLKAGARGVAGSLAGRRLRTLLVTVQVALVMVLLAGAGLLTRSFRSLAEVNPGFRSDHILASDISLVGQAYTNEMSRLRFVEQLLAQQSKLTEVESASAVDGFPLDPGRSIMDVELTSIQGTQPSAPGEKRTAILRLITPDYFRTMGITLARGRPFLASDNQNSLPVVIINEALARRYFAGADAIGKRISSPDFGQQPCEIVGVIRNIRQTSLDANPRPEAFRPLLQECFSSVTAVVRTRSEPAGVFANMQKLVGNIDRGVPVFNFRTLRQVVSNSLAPRRFGLVLMGAFAGLSLLLALVGLYGVLSCLVNESRRELGIRLAIGASSWQVLRLVLIRGMQSVFVGAVIGLLGACALTRYLQSFLYNLSPTDPLTFGLVLLFIVVISLLACWVPARRAANVDPVVALRCE